MINHCDRKLSSRTRNRKIHASQNNPAGKRFVWLAEIRENGLANVGHRILWQWAQICATNGAQWSREDQFDDSK